MTTITEIASDIYRISTNDPNIDLQFIQFLVKDEEPLLFHTGLKKMFPLVRDAVGKILEPSQIRWISFSHFEADECGSLNQWLTIAPNAQTVCSPLATFVSIDDFAIRPSKSMQNAEVLNTGKYNFQFYHTPQVPHGWDAGLFFETTNKTLFCSDLFHQFGDLEPITESDDKLADFHPGIIAASTEPKAIETAQIIAQKFNQPVEVFGGLQECDRTNFGFVEEKKFFETLEAFFATPDKLVMGLETATRAFQRFQQAVENIIAKTPDGDVMIVSHGTVITLFIAGCTSQEPFAFWQQLGQPMAIALPLPNLNSLEIITFTSNKL